MRAQRRARRAEQAVGDGEQRFVRPFGAGVEAVDGQQPRRVVDHGRDLAPARELVREQRRERRRTARQADDALREALRFDPDRAHRGARAAWATSIIESLPVNPPSGPNSSPPISTRSADIPSARSSSRTARAESDLSVRPISTCFASLVTFGSEQPASRAASSAMRAASTRPSIPAARSRCSTVATTRSITAFGGSAHSGSGSRSIFRRLSRRETTRASNPRAASRATVSSAARVERAVLVDRRLASGEEARSVSVHLEQLRSAVEREEQPAGPCRSGAELAVDVVDMGSAHHCDVDTGAAELFDERPHRRRVRGAIRYRRTVPVEDDRLEASREGAREVRLDHRRRRRRRCCAHAVTVCRGV